MLSFSPRLLLAVPALAGSLALVAGHPTSVRVAPDPNNAGLKLPAGFGALVAAETGGKARHIAVTPQGVIYVKLNKVKDGKGILELHSQPTGKASITGGFGDYGGTGMYEKNGYLYASSDHAVYRYKLDGKGEVVDRNKPELLVRGLKVGSQHESKSIVLDNADNLYVNIGAYANACQEQDRTRGSKGIPNCPILDSAGGIWQFKADRLNQRYPDGTRYATGLRNVVGLDWNPQDNQLFVMQHGRDQLHDNWSELYGDKESAALPAECLYALKPGANAGWPYTYYDQQQHEIMKGPEYGGDGKTPATGDYLKPAAAYPGHMAPDGPVPQRRLHCLPRLLEPRSRAAKGLFRGLPAFQKWQARWPVGGICRQLRRLGREGGQWPRRPPPLRPRPGPRRLALRERRLEGHYLPHRV